MSKVKPRLIIGLGCIVLLGACNQSGGQSERSPIAPQSLKEIMQIADKKNIRSLLVSHQGELIVEKYFQSYSGDSLDHLRSATKSIMTTLVGIALDKGMLGDVNDPISKYIQEVPADKNGITVGHLMNMTSGLQWNEGAGYNDNNKMIDSGNPLKHMMALPVVNNPGSHWEYSTGDIHLLSVVLTEATGMDTQAFAKQYLFEPLGITEWKWQQFGDGYFSGGSRLQLKPADMLRIGLMYLNEGVHEGERVLSADFASSSTEVIAEHSRSSTEVAGYGYGWWTIRYRGIKAFKASGYAGQTIGVVPSSDLVLVATHDWRVGADQAIDQQNHSQEIINAFWMWLNSDLK